MTATFHIHGDELNEDFFRRLHEMFGHRPVQVIVMESDDDETDAIRNNPHLYARVRSALDRTTDGIGFVQVDIDSVE